MTREISRRSFVACASVLPLGAVTAVSGRRARATRMQDRAWIPSDEFLERLPAIMQLASVPGLSMAVVENGTVAWSRALGVRDARTGATVDDDTLFEAASLSKPVVAFLALLLRDEGRLDLDRPLADIVAPVPLPPDADTRRITARHVLSHSSGLRNWRSRTDQEFAPAFTPGSRFSYSGEGFVWLQRVLEHVTERPFTRLVRERVLEPLGMRASTFLWRPELESRTAVGHGYRGDAGESPGRALARAMHAMAATENRSAEDWRYEDAERAMPRLDANVPALPNFMLPNAAASLLTTGTEYARFLAHLALDSPPAPALARATRAEMLSPTSNLNGPLAWGLGWGLERRAHGGHWLWHWGDNGNAKAFVLGDPHAKRALVVFANGAGGHKVYQRIFHHAVADDLASLVWV